MMSAPMPKADETGRYAERLLLTQIGHR